MRRIIDIRGMEAQLHVGQTAPTAKGFKPAVNRPGGWLKPIGGMWTSTYDPQYGSGWVQWCLSEDWGVPADGWRAWVLQPEPTASVLTIDTLVDLRRTCARYAMAECHGYCPLDFVAIARDFDAVRLTEGGQWATRLSHPHSLYGWDCESTVWLRWTFASVTPLGVLAWPMQQDDLLPSPPPVTIP